MIANNVIFTMLATGLVAPLAQDVTKSPATEAARAMWPHMHQCTLAPVSRLAIKTKGTSAQRSLVEGDSDGGWTRIDLHLAGLPDGSGGPTISAHAINTKGTGANTGRTSSDIAINTKGTGTSSGRMSGSDFQGRIEVACVSSQVVGDEATQKATMASFNYMRADGTGLGWSCSVSGSEDKPVFRIDLLIPTILGQAEKSASWSWGVSNSRVSIIARSAEQSDNWHVACASKEPRTMNYDLAVMKKV